ncbi:hypothetical protein HY837_02140 [archaeon]|nr:hypothetical protein [archaeon]
MKTKKCPECSSEDIFVGKDGEYICKDCGLVIEEFDDSSISYVNFMESLDFPDCPKCKEGHLKPVLIEEPFDGTFSCPVCGFKEKREKRLPVINLPEKPKKCPECKGEIVDDGDDSYCKKCGLVVEEKFSRTGIGIEKIDEE